MRVIAMVIGCLLAIAWSSATFSQTGPDPNNTIEGENPALKKDPNVQERQPDDNKPLSEKLEENDGVIKPPPGIDPQIRKPPPDTGSNMPVIVPPGEPGGNPNVQPK